MFNEHMRRKEEIRNKIELLTREKHTLEKIKIKDVPNLQ